MSHLVRVNAGQKQVTLTNKRTYDGPADVTLTDDEFARLRPALFPSVLTDLGGGNDPVTGALNLVSQTTSTTAPAAGGAAVLPLTPLGYLTVNINGTPRKIAYY